MKRLLLCGTLFLGICCAFSKAESVETAPSEIYKAYHQALRQLDLKRLRFYWLPREDLVSSEEALEKEVMRIHQISPPEMEILNEKIVGNEAFLKVLGFYPNGGKSKGIVYLLKTRDRWQVRGEEWGFLELPPPPLKTGEGAIEGIITLPPVDRKGDLYVFAVLKNQDTPTGFTVIPKERVVWKVIPYRIAGLPSGSFWVYAYWDTTPPYMDPAKGNFSVFTGDYAGEFGTAVTLYAKETRSRIDFACSRDLKAKEEENYGKVYFLVDLGVTVSPEGKPVFLLSIRNTGVKPVRHISLVCKMNGKELSYTASSPGTLIPPQEVREFDITTCYESYLFFLDKIWTGEALSKKTLKFEILSKDNGSSLNKEIVVEEGEDTSSGDEGPAS